ncbi:MAG: response regulator transcription factor [Solirubrobacterales bacterium]|nr:response regulator transcription factor [Solirubrobacterales bacterium]MBV9473441.1 response regulator transcription factor [Solirubrobacterales bacterium]MBV9839823.1 response regulator transcription factor [Solirubrobacterales bacterium]
MRPRLLIADHAPTRMGVRMAIGELLEVCAEADRAHDAILAAQRLQPDICLVGMELPGGGIAAVEGICKVAPAALTIVLAGTHDPDDLLDSVRAGAVGYLPGRVDATRLRRAVEAAVGREAVVPRGMVLDLLLALRSGASLGTRGLTNREAQVLAMLRRGHSTAAIAQRLAISAVTVRRHISELVHKAGVEDRAQLIEASRRSTVATNGDAAEPLART